MVWQIGLPLAMNRPQGSAYGASFEAPMQRIARMHHWHHTDALLAGRDGLYAALEPTIQPNDVLHRPHPLEDEGCPPPQTDLQRLCRPVPPS